MEKPAVPNTSSIKKDSGMGLSVVHGIVKNFGGEIVVSSRVGQGTTFTILLPKAEGKIEEQIPAGPLPTGTEHILIVDDEDFFVALQEKMLEQLGYKVTAMTSSPETLELFKKAPQQFDLVITDLTMPMLTGDQLASEIMTIRPDMPIVLMTGQTDVIDDRKLDQIGINAFMSKPCDRQQLAETIRKILDKK